MFKKFIIAVFLVTTLLCTPAVAADVTMAWDANIESDLAGYRMYRSELPGQYTFGMDSSNMIGMMDCDPNDNLCCNFIDMDLPENKTYYWVVTAVDDQGAESGPSNEVTAKIGNIAPSKPSNCIITTIAQ